ncbi:hypothetical protein QR680_010353 [Steinernema hermaphroditum]|uniref:Uncharacterized protein n=1 Tax=Steinernema hermaphroditum TaxID=289476 RepID=A0AA39IPW8_9BILA|nr:hypothetical protein QR680_010353 [Steinernema hermaphroditum]
MAFYLLNISKCSLTVIVCLIRHKMEGLLRKIQNFRHREIVEAFVGRFRVIFKTPMKIKTTTVTTITAF